MRNIMKAIEQAGGSPFMVGGCVRDQLMGIVPKDIDIEVFNLSSDKLIEVLKTFGKVDQVGVSFGVIKLKTDKDDYDFSLPRRENKEGRGHKGFQVEVDHTLSPLEAALRRDFTMNAVSIDMDGNVVDPLGGIGHIHARRLVATSPKFAEDPLRVLRGMQFAGRFDMRMNKATIELCKSIFHEADTIAIERINTEIVKWATKSIKPSRGIEVLVKTGWISLFPELECLVGLGQDPTYHPEGDVLTHTALVCDAAADIATRDVLSDSDRLVLVLAALCHDLGKATTTIVDEQGKIRSPKHAQEGVAPTRSLLERMGFQESVISKVVPLVSCHMDHLGVRANKTFVRRLSKRVTPSSIAQLVRLMEADRSGRPPLPKKCPEVALDILRISSELDISNNQPIPILMGRHLIELGVQPSPEFSKLLGLAFEAQLDGEFDDLDGAILFVKMLINT